jgi:predicted aldo/keto reductase-like oxidoreductase
MEYRKINNEEVSLLGFGCMRFSEDKNGKIIETKAFEMLNYAYQQGFNYYDSAYVYHHGESELLLGKWLKTIDRTTVKIATKLPLLEFSSLKEAKAIFENQLRKLDVEYIDYYLLHALRKTSWDKIIELQVLTYLEEMVKQGKIKNLGFSFHDDFEIFEEVINAYPWDFTQIQLNYMDVDYQAGLKGLKLAKKHDIAVIVMEPLKGGLIARLPKEETDILASNYSAANIAMRWVASFPEVAVILSGMSELSDVIENIEILSTPFPCSEIELEKIAQIKLSLNEKILVDCTSCGYCMPCDFNVNIPDCFKYLNVGNRYHNYETARHNYEFNVEDHKASNCAACGACLEKCPQRLNIPELLKLVVEKLEK